MVKNEIQLTKKLLKPTKKKYSKIDTNIAITTVFFSIVYFISINLYFSLYLYLVLSLLKAKVKKKSKNTKIIAIALKRNNTKEVIAIPVAIQENDCTGSNRTVFMLQVTFREQLTLNWICFYLNEIFGAGYLVLNNKYQQLSPCYKIIAISDLFVHYFSSYLHDKNCILLKFC